MSLRGPARALPSVTMALLYYPLLAVMVGLLYLWGIRGLYSRFGLRRRSGGKAVSTRMMIPITFPKS